MYTHIPIKLLILMFIVMEEKHTANHSFCQLGVPAEPGPAAWALLCAKGKVTARQP